MGILTFSLNVTLDGCVDHQEGIADDETHAFFTGMLDEAGAMLWGRTTYEMMEEAWPPIARGEVEASPALRDWAVKLDAKPKYVVSSTRTDFPWVNSHHLAGDLGTAVRALLSAQRLRRALYAGDDTTDLDAFRALDGLELGVRVAVVTPEAPVLLRGAADVVVGGPAELLELLRRL